MIPRGTELTFTVKGSTTTSWWSLFTVAEFEGDARDHLNRTLDVVSLSIDASTFTAGVIAYQYTAIVTVRTRVDHAQADDVASIVAHTFYVIAGSMPSVTSGGFAGFKLPKLPSLPLSTTIGLAAIALILIAWKVK